MSDNVEISRAYLESLMRRLDAYENDRSITIPAAHHDSLVLNANKYQWLTAGLLERGVESDFLEHLIESQQNKLLVKDNATVAEKSSSSEVPLFSHGKPGPIERPTRKHQSNKLKDTHTPTLISLMRNLHREEISDELESKEYYETDHKQRSLVFNSLPQRATLLDIVSIIQGGAIANIYIRHRYHTAHVSFVDPQAATEFLAYASRNKITVLNKKIHVCWDEQQATLPGYVVKHIWSKGATRNLVIHSPSPDMTAEELRNDLAHIHHLEVVDIVFEAGSIWIQLNSVWLAMMAKTCMQSRLRYKKSRIEYFADACKEPLQLAKVPAKGLTSRGAVGKPTPIALTNRFQTLLDGSVEDTSD